MKVPLWSDTIMYIFPFFAISCTFLPILSSPIPGGHSSAYIDAWITKPAACSWLTPAVILVLLFPLPSIFGLPTLENSPSVRPNANCSSIYTAVQIKTGKFVIFSAARLKARPMKERNRSARSKLYFVASFSRSTLALVYSNRSLFSSTAILWSYSVFYLLFLSHVSLQT